MRNTEHTRISNSLQSQNSSKPDPNYRKSQECKKKNKPRERKRIKRNKAIDRIPNSQNPTKLTAKTPFKKNHKP